MAWIDRWQGKTALITGASSGIGVAFAHLLAGAGCHLILTARREDRLASLRDELAERHGVSVQIITQDLAEFGAGRALFEQVSSLGVPVDVLINNAGYGLSGLFVNTDWEREQRMILLNVMSLVELTKLVLPGMLERGSGGILLVSSIAAFMPIPTFAVYAATKAFVTRFGVALGHELRKTRVRVSVLNPGGTETEFLDVAGMTATRVTHLGMMSAEKVARIGLRALARRRRSVIAGVMNTVMTWLATRLLPMGLRLRAAAVFQKLAGGGK